MGREWINSFNLFEPFGSDATFHGYILSNLAQLDVENMARQHFKKYGKFYSVDFVKNIFLLQHKAYLLDKGHLGAIEFGNDQNFITDFGVTPLNGLYFYEVYNEKKPPLSFNGIIITELKPEQLLPMVGEFLKNAKNKNAANLQKYINKLGYFAKHPKVRLVNYET